MELAEQLELTEAFRTLIERGRTTERSVECPYADDEVIYEVRLVTGKLLTGRFTSHPALPSPGFWTLVPWETEEEGWLDVNPSQIVAVGPVPSDIEIPTGRPRP